MTLLHCLVALGIVFAVAGMAPADEPKKEPPAKPVARMVHYSGRVQGVGFRATVVQIAGNFPVTGWVKNLADGRVQLLVEGSEEAVGKFLAAVRTHWKHHVEKETVTEETPTGKYGSFTIRR
jgi:acylphosphatase